VRLFEIPACWNDLAAGMLKALAPTEPSVVTEYAESANGIVVCEFIRQSP
jgi:hypothetical protein